MKRVDDKKISDVMNVKVITAREDMTIKELKSLFDKHDFNAFPVVRGAKVVGIVTKMDLFKTFSTGRKATLRQMYDLWATSVEDIMRRAVVSVEPDDAVLDAVDYMVEFKLRSLPVIKNGDLVGIVSRGDLLPHLIVEDE